MQSHPATIVKDCCDRRRTLKDMQRHLLGVRVVGVLPQLGYGCRAVGNLPPCPNDQSLSLWSEKTLFLPFECFATVMWCDQLRKRCQRRISQFAKCRTSNIHSHTSRNSATILQVLVFSSLLPSSYPSESLIGRHLLQTDVRVFGALICLAISDCTPPFLRHHE